MSHALPIKTKMVKGAYSRARDISGDFVALSQCYACSIQKRRSSTRGHLISSTRESALDQSYFNLHAPRIEHKILRRRSQVPRSFRTVHAAIVAGLEVDSRQGAGINGVVGPSD